MSMLANQVVTSFKCGLCGSSMRSIWSFCSSCANAVAETQAAQIRQGPATEPKPMRPTIHLKWNSGVSTSLAWCGTTQGELTDSERDVTCERCLRRLYR